MSWKRKGSSTVEPDPALQRNRPRACRNGVDQCLVVSPSERRLNELASAAKAGGWDTVACSEASEGLNLCRRVWFGLALIDLGTSLVEANEGLRRISEELTAGQQPLVVVCGIESDTGQEIWARSLGSWMYLPGLPARDGLIDIFRQALTVIQKTHSAGYPKGMPVGQT